MKKRPKFLIPWIQVNESYYVTISGKVFFAKTISGKGFVIQKEHVRRPSVREIRQAINRETP